MIIARQTYLAWLYSSSAVSFELRLYGPSSRPNIVIQLIILERQGADSGWARACRAGGPCCIKHRTKWLWQVSLKWPKIPVSCGCLMNTFSLCQGIKSTVLYETFPFFLPEGGQMALWCMYYETWNHLSHLTVYILAWSYHCSRCMINTTCVKSWWCRSLWHTFSKTVQLCESTIQIRI